MKTYCTSCGQESQKKICEHCGVKKNVAANFCPYCGAELFDRATICVNCKEKVKKDSPLWTILSYLFSAVILVFMFVAISVKDPIISIILLFLAAVLCLPFFKTIIKNLTTGKKGLRKFLKIVRILVIVGLFAASVIIAGSKEEVKNDITVEEAYADLVTYAENDKFIEGWRVTQAVPDVLEYKDGQKYHDYCQAMRAYNAGALGYAYNALIKVPDILDSKSVAEKISAEIGHLEGHFVADNKTGSYLHIIVKNGLVATEIQGYNDDEDIVLSDEDCHDSIIISKYDNGKEFIGFGSYNTIGEKVTIDYVINQFDDEDEIMVIRYAGNEYSTFNGLYTRKD